MSTQTEIDHTWLIALIGKLKNMAYRCRNIRRVKRRLDNRQIRFRRYPSPTALRRTAAIAGRNTRHMSSMGSRVDRLGGIARVNLARVKFHTTKWLRVLGRAESPHIDQGIGHQLHAIVPTLLVLEPQQ